MDPWQAPSTSAIWLTMRIAYQYQYIGVYQIIGIGSEYRVREVEKWKGREDERGNEDHSAISRGRYSVGSNRDPSIQKYRYVG